MDKKIEKEKQKETDYRRLGTRHPACPCGETNTVALTGVHPNIICYECLAEKEGRSKIEQDHVARRCNSAITISSPGNNHRRVTRGQDTWPLKTRLNPDKSPILRDAAITRGIAEWIEPLLGVAEQLEWLDEELERERGPKWWKNSQLPK